mmetsp:Transcript_77671/g.152027  ORF Transcript_77671/g.152027 Transcript_77671/m.152027 type:complete len:233 (+) Transcript_77671:372-1070(+)
MVSSVTRGVHANCSASSEYDTSSYGGVTVTRSYGWERPWREGFSRTSPTDAHTLAPAPSQSKPHHATFFSATTQQSLAKSTNVAWLAPRLRDSIPTLPDPENRSKCRIPACAPLNRSSKHPKPVRVEYSASFTFPIMGRSWTSGLSSRRPRAMPPMTRSRDGFVIPLSRAFPWLLLRRGSDPPCLLFKSERLKRGALRRPIGSPFSSTSGFLRTSTTTRSRPSFVLAPLRFA